MFEFEASSIASGRGRRYLLALSGAPLTFEEVLHLWQNDPTFCRFFTSLLAGAPYVAYKWETPRLSMDILLRRFEFVVLDSPSLSRSPDSHAFSEHFSEADIDEQVIVFENLGGDATMVVPCPRTANSAYAHLAAFVREAPETQQVALWRTVGYELEHRIQSRPTWLSTAGGGVPWLHVRLDDRPKYYGFDDYRSG